MCEPAPARIKGTLDGFAAGGGAVAYRREFATCGHASPVITQCDARDLTTHKSTSTQRRPNERHFDDEGLVRVGGGGKQGCRKPC